MKGKFYNKNGVEYISVTTALSIINKPQLNDWRESMGIEEADRIMHEKADLGKKFHKYVEMISNGEGWDIPEDSIPAPLIPKVRAFRDWFYANVKEVVCSELEVFSDKYKYAGRLDQGYLLKGEKDPDLIDIKTGDFLDRSVPWQLSAYQNAAKEEKGINFRRRIILQFGNKKQFSGPIIYPITDNCMDFNSFLIALELFKRYYNK